MISHEHPRLGKLIFIRSADELTQGDVEKFTAAYRSLNGQKEPNVNHGQLVRAAIQAGWIVEPALTVEAVESLPARRVRWMGGLVDKLFDEATTVDPKSLTPSPITLEAAGEPPSS